MIAWFKTLLARRAHTRAGALCRARQWPSAEAEYLKAIRLTSAASARGVAKARQVAGEAHLGLGRLYLHLSQPARSLNEFNLACSMLPGNWVPLYYRGCGQGWSGNYAKAEEDFTAALSINGAEARIYVQRGHARFKSWRLEQALFDYLEAQRRGGLEGKDRLALAALRMCRGEFSEAEQLLRPLAEKDYSTACLWLGGALELQDKWGDAAAAYERATRVEGARSQAYARLGVVYVRLRQYERAAAWLEKALGQRQETDPVLFCYGWVCYRLGRFRPCIHAWEQLRRRHPKQQRLDDCLQKAVYAAGCERERAGDYDAAIRLWDNYCYGGRDDTLLARPLAELHLRAAAAILKRQGTHSFDKVGEHLKAACKIAPDDSRFRFYLALVTALGGDLRRASELLKAALALDPQDRRLQYHLALLAGEQGDHAAAAATLQSISTQNGSGPWPRRAAESLAALYVVQERWPEATDTLLSCADRHGTPSPNFDAAQAGEADGPDYYELMAACLAHTGRLEDLLRLPAEQQAVSYWQALGCAQQRCFEQAVAKLRGVLKRQPDHQLARQALATVYKELFLRRAVGAEWASAVKALDQARRDRLAANHNPHSSSEADTATLEALAFILSGRRQDAMRALEEAFRSNPASGAVAHSLGLVSYYTAHSAERDEDFKAASQAWRRVIAAWAVILHDETFWEGLRLDAQKRYEAGVSVQDVTALREEIKRHLIKIFSARPVEDASDAPARRAKGWQSHEGLLHQEIRAASALQEAGGFTLSGVKDKKLVCGPLMIQLLGCQVEFGRFVASLQTQTPNSVPEIYEVLQELLGPGFKRPDDRRAGSPQRQRLMRYFSQLGTAQALLELSRPLEALEALADAACRRCRGSKRRDGARKGAPRYQIKVCADDCPQFELLNSGYAGTRLKGARLTQDAVELAIDAHLTVAQSAITAAAMNKKTACAHWSEALERAKVLGEEAGQETQRRIVAAAAGRGQVLCAAKRWDEAVNLLEQARGICRGRHQQEMTGWLAEALNGRGVVAANSKPPRWEEAVESLRRAVSLSPHTIRPRINLCRSLFGWGMQHLEEGRESAAIRLLEEIIERVTEVGSIGANHATLRQCFEDACANLSMLHNKRGVIWAEAEMWPTAIAEIEAALNFAPGNALVERNFKQICRDYAIILFSDGRAAEGMQVLEKLRRRFPNDQFLL